jgi:uncharacterized protein YodC (DUF2158 family)
MPEQFKAGDQVQLKSGGPTMTVEAIDDEEGMTRAHCVWFDHTTEKRSSFSVDALTSASGHGPTTLVRG